MEKGTLRSHCSPARRHGSVDEVSCCRTSGHCVLSRFPLSLRWPVAIDENFILRNPPDSPAVSAQKISGNLDDPGFKWFKFAELAGWFLHQTKEVSSCLRPVHARSYSHIQCLGKGYLLNMQQQPGVDYSNLIKTIWVQPKYFFTSTPPQCGQRNMFRFCAAHVRVTLIQEPQSVFHMMMRM